MHEEGWKVEKRQGLSFPDRGSLRVGDEVMTVGSEGDITAVSIFDILSLL